MAQCARTGVETCVGSFGTNAATATTMTANTSANMNQGPNIDNMKLWWHRLAVYDENPGWVGF
jgi:hypothetical protein